MKRLVAVLLPIVVGAALLVPRGAAQGTNAKPLEIWVVDVEGGKAALYVSPTGQTALIDTGFPGARDHDRIMAAIADAGVKQIDYLVSTHYHVDHIGDLMELANRIPIMTYVDHGPSAEGPTVPQTRAGPGRSHPHETTRADRGFPGGLCGAVQQGEAHRRETGGSRADYGSRVADCDSGRQRAEDAAAGRRQAEPALRELHAAPHQRRDGRSRRLPFGGQRGHPGPVPRRRFRRHVADQGARADVSEQSDRDGRSLLREQSRRDRVGFASVRARPPAARRAAAERHPQRRRGRSDDDDSLVARVSRGSGRCTGRTTGCVEQNTPGLYIANIEDMPTIAGVLTAPPRGGGPGRGAGGAAPPAAAGAPPATGAAPPTAAAPPPAAPPSAAPPAAAPVARPGTTGRAPAAGRGRGNATGHTPAYWLKISAQPDGSFTITNPRNGFSKTYGPRVPARPTR